MAQNGLFDPPTTPQGQIVEKMFLFNSIKLGKGNISTGFGGEKFTGSLLTMFRKPVLKLVSLCKYADVPYFTDGSALREWVP